MSKIKKIVKCHDNDEALAVMRTLNEGDHNHSEYDLGVSVSRNVVLLDLKETRHTFDKETIKRIRQAAKGVRNLRRALAIHYQPQSHRPLAEARDDSER